MERERESEGVKTGQPTRRRDGEREGERVTETERVRERQREGEGAVGIYFLNEEMEREKGRLNCITICTIHPTKPTRSQLQEPPQHKLP